MRIRLDSIGCRLNIGEIEAMARSLAASGHVIAPSGEPADLCVLNTCTVTAIASRKSRHFIRQLRRANPEAKIIVTGCLAELEADTVEALGVDLVIGNNAKDTLPEMLARKGWLDEPDIDAAPITAPAESRTRAFLKVQDGCDNACTFCVVTIARGGGRSIDGDSIINEIRDLRTFGYREVVLSGVHLGSYGHDLGDSRGLERLIRRILTETDLPRLRLSSLEPWDLDSGFFEVFSDRRLLPHLHLPLQSGCDATLKRMARKTTIEGFAALTESARGIVGDLAISTDVMVGFPGESDADFEESMATVEALGFSRLHIFRYSRRDGTRAAGMPHQIPGDIAQERSRRLHELGDKLMADFHSGFIGRQLEILWEESMDLGSTRRWSGLTGNYIRVLTETDGDIDLTNEITPATIETCVPGAVLGSVPGISTAGTAAKPRRLSEEIPIIDPNHSSG